VAVGQCQGTSGHAFRSNRYLKNTDTTPPQVNSLTNSITEGTIYGAAERKEALTESYSGTIYISFTEALYYKVSSEVRQKIVDISPTAAVIPDKYRSSLSLLGDRNTKFGINFKVGSLSGSDWDNPPDCMDLEITFTNCRVGDTITFDSNLCDTNNNPGARPLALTLTLVEETSGTGANRVTILNPTFDYANTTVAGIWRGTAIRN